MEYEQYYISAPAIWASFLVNNDSSSLSKEELERATAWFIEQDEGIVFDCSPDESIGIFDGELINCLHYAFEGKQ